jgi:hypothetical protein
MGGSVYNERSWMGILCTLFVIFIQFGTMCMLDSVYEYVS